MKLNTFATEYEECLALVEYFELKKIPYAHIHQEFFTKSWKQKNLAKALGVKKGIPDYLCILKDKLVFVEMKSSRGRPSPEQQDWIEKFNKCESVIAVIAYGFDEAKEIIDDILKK